MVLKQFLSQKLEKEKKTKNETEKRGGGTEQKIGLKQTLFNKHLVTSVYAT